VVNLDPVLAATVGRQVERMVEVRRVFVFMDTDIIHREVALLRASLSEEQEREILVRYPEARALQRGAGGTLLQMTGTETEIGALVTELKTIGLNEFVRSGRIAVTMSGDFERDLSQSMHEMRPTADEGPDF
jgi:acetolactate synthase-1/3 small subunit